MEKHKQEVSQRILKERLSGDGMAPLEKLKMKQTFWCFLGAGGSGSAFHKEKERKNSPKTGVLNSHPSVPRPPIRLPPFPGFLSQPIKKSFLQLIS